jgi:hypothetical protein
MSRLPPNRYAYLNLGLSFEQIAAWITAELQIHGARIKPYNAPARGEPKNSRQIVFLVQVGAEVCDLFYNAPDGLRGRYWQSPDHGFAATRHLLGMLSPALLSFAEQYPPTPSGKAAPMDLPDVRASLEAPSAKIWPRERDDNSDSLLAEQELVVPRWVAHEECAEFNKGEWRKAPIGDELEIKGALLGTDGTEYLPEGKRNRSCQIHRSGYT